MDNTYDVCRGDFSSEDGGGGLIVDDGGGGDAGANRFAPVTVPLLESAGCSRQDHRWPWHRRCHLYAQPSPPAVDNETTSILTAEAQVANVVLALLVAVVGVPL